MKIIMLSLIPFICSPAYSQSDLPKNKEMNKQLVVYFSATGTTASVAKQLAEAAGADLLEIVPQQPYTSRDLNWNDRNSRSSKEMNDPKSRPAIITADITLDEYDTIFLGYPIWWDLAPRPVNTFIDSYDLAGKTVIPFATSGGSSIRGSVNALKKEYPEIKWQEGRLLNNPSASSLQNWLSNLQQ